MWSKASIVSAASSRVSSSHEKYIIKILCLIEGILLVIVCLGGLDFKVHRKTSFAIENYHYATQPKLKGWDDERLRRKSDETDLAYATRMNKVVGSSFYHCLYSTKENIFEIVAVLFLKSASRYGFLQPGRNCGFCHQAAYILAKVLMAQGIKAIPLGMIGHVCVLMEDGNDKYIFDPDYAVGPMRYLDDMTPYIPVFYGTGQAYNALYEPFATNIDDRPYSSLQHLNALEQEQNRILGVIKKIYYFCVVAMILNTLLIIMKICGNKD